MYIGNYSGRRSIYSPDIVAIVDGGVGSRIAADLCANE